MLSHPLTESVVIDGAVGVGAGAVALNTDQQVNCAAEEDAVNKRWFVWFNTFKFLLVHLINTPNVLWIGFYFLYKTGAFNLGYMKFFWKMKCCVLTF